MMLCILDIAASFPGRPRAWFDNQRAILQFIN